MLLITYVRIIILIVKLLVKILTIEDKNTTLKEAKVSTQPKQRPQLASPRHITYFVQDSQINTYRTPSMGSEVVGHLNQNQCVIINPMTRIKAEHMYWCKSTKAAWVPEKMIDDSIVFLSPDPPFTIQPPVDIEQVQWIYYFGNSSFAYHYGKLKNYDGYSQGLQGGLNFGHMGKPQQLEIVAGVNGIFDYAGSGRAFAPGRVDILVNSFLIIYGNIEYVTHLQRGDEITPETVIGRISTSSKVLFLEIRRGGYIYNPLLFFEPTTRQKIFEYFPPIRQFGFFKSDFWTEWQHPLDQPIIKLGGPVIGPKTIRRDDRQPKQEL